MISVHYSGVVLGSGSRVIKGTICTPKGTYFWPHTIDSGVEGLRRICVKNKWNCPKYELGLGIDFGISCLFLCVRLS